MPLLYAPFETSHHCCQILKKAPIKETTLGGLQPMIGEKWQITAKQEWTHTARQAVTCLTKKGKE